MDDEIAKYYKAKTIKFRNEDGHDVSITASYSMISGSVITIIHDYTVDLIQVNSVTLAEAGVMQALLTHILRPEGL